MQFIENNVIHASSYLDKISQLYRSAEADALAPLLAKLQPSAAEREAITQTAIELIERTRQAQADEGSLLETFLATYDLSSQEGIALMCLAESLLRIPDAATADKLIEEKIGGSDWQAHLGQGASLFVNAATWGLLLTGKVVGGEMLKPDSLLGSVKKLFTRAGEPLIRQALRQSMRILGQQFVMGETIEAALKRAEPLQAQGYRYSYDMLGEAACTQADADAYFQAYASAIEAIGKASIDQDVYASPGISVKLSALHPRYEYTQIARLQQALVPKIIELACMAQRHNIGFTIDAEEADRLQLSLTLIDQVLAADALSPDWQGFGLAVQAYQKAAPAVLQACKDFAEKYQRRLNVRLVKGAYWDSEIKWAQEQGFNQYPVYTRKMSTDTAYLYCAQWLLDNTDFLYPQFATHNAYTIAAVLTMADKNTDFEFQRLHGMGEALYNQVIDKAGYHIPCRVYAPVGDHQHLLAYLVRRLLENGANSSFVHQIMNQATAARDLAVSPVEQLRALKSKPHPGIALPRALFGEARENSTGMDLSDVTMRGFLKEALQLAAEQIPWQAYPLIDGKTIKPIASKPVVNPGNHAQVVGEVFQATADNATQAVDVAAQAFARWDNTPVIERAEILRTAADLLDEHRAELMAMAVLEAGKSVLNAQNEIREAIDFCRYYALQAEQHMAKPVILQGPTGEKNQLSWQGRGVTVCISPWNFPLAIFIGQIAAALVTGNPVIAKPAEQTALIAYRAVALLHQAGVPTDVLQFLPGKGQVIGNALTTDPRVASVIFTGSTETAHTINRSLAAREQAALATLVAETGGQNALVVDSSALLEQVVHDAVFSAFDSAGQRCSALRVLCLQDDIADEAIAMLKGAMAELSVGDPALLATDVGPVIDKDAQQRLLKHIEQMHKQARLIYQVAVPETIASQGTFVAPCAFEIDSIDVLKREVFGPVLHVVRYQQNALKPLLNAINASGYGLTFGVHSRIEHVAQEIFSQVRAGNTYINRNIIGAVVGVQPFGGQNLSGTGPKAGGPHYLQRLATEKTLSINTTAMGGNATLLSLDDAQDVDVSL